MSSVEEEGKPGDQRRSENVLSITKRSTKGWERVYRQRQPLLVKLCLLRS